MSKNAQHQWEPVAGPDNLVRCKKCGSEVKASRARRGVGPCIWGESGSSVPNADPPPVPEEKPVILRTSEGEISGHDTVQEAVDHADGDSTITVYPTPVEATEARALIVPPGPRLTDPPEICNGCGERLAILPLNSRLDMVACNNGHCALYRERLRMVTKPTKRGKRKRGNNN